ncbi:Conserved_hypothetical protein [Hexamita inflata]|uniref:Uncharacterized protein n=1 Tax=Hexamita inflata TaxID=28002 RepID=A0AA86TJB0_9EUKA|nr:Conserved hypothetical protein [Hexamita inflata]
MYFKFVQQVVNNALQIQNDQTLTDFGFTREMKIHTLNIQNCQNVKLPFQNSLKYLKTDLNGTLINYPEVITLPKMPIQITSLTINNCKLTNIVGLENMKQLKYLNIKDNQIILIEQLQKLNCLQQVLIDNNFVQDLEYLVNQDWVSEQRVPTDANLQAYLTDINSNLTIDAFKAQISPKKVKSDQLIAPLLAKQYAKQDSELSNRFKSQVNYNKLEIINDSSVKDIKCIDQISVECLILNKCTNISFKRAPTQLLYLTLNDCNITDLEGLQQFKELKKLELIKNTQIQSVKQIFTLKNLLSLTISDTNLTNLVGIQQLSKLQYIDLRDNCIVSVEPLKPLQYIKQLLLDNNQILDLEHLTTMKNYNSDWIYYQKQTEDVILIRQTYLIQIQILLQMS